MKIIHICLASSYTEGMAYQDNILPEVNSNDGHEVIIISNTEEYKNGNLVPTSEEEKILNKNLKLIRVNFDFYFSDFITKKIRKTKKLKKILEKFKPDVILFHGMCGYELLTVSKYKKQNPNIKLYVDSHEDFTNSATNFISKNILHRLFYKVIALKSLKYIDKVLYISEETRIFLKDFYKIPIEKLEFYPLGGFIKEPFEKEIIRKRIRKKLQINENELVLLHSGKLDKLKKTRELLEAFNKVKSNNIYLLIIGNIPVDEKDELEKLIKEDTRVIYLGWKNSDELLEYICAADLYMQPGSQSSTALTAVCCGLPILLYPSISYLNLFDSNAFWAKSITDIIIVLENIIEKPENLEKMSIKSYEIARNILDYNKLARRLYF